MKYWVCRALIAFLFPLFVGFTGHGSEKVLSRETSEELYDRLFISANSPSREAFHLALCGMHQILREGKMNADKPYLTIIDFSKPSTEERLWVVDMRQEKILFNCLVAHGRNTGDNWAREFSNIPQSYQSSLGFYVTGETYTGKHGLSLYLNGMEPGVNDKARERAIVMHGAEYVSREFIEKTGRLGRSFGCPAVSMDIYEPLIETITGQTCLFIWYPDTRYLSISSYLSGSITSRDQPGEPVF